MQEEILSKFTRAGRGSRVQTCHGAARTGLRTDVSAKNTGPSDLVSRNVNEDVVISERLGLKIEASALQDLVDEAEENFCSNKQKCETLTRTFAKTMYHYLIADTTPTYWLRLVPSGSPMEEIRRQENEGLQERIEFDRLVRRDIAEFVATNYQGDRNSILEVLRDVGKQKRKNFTQKRQRNENLHKCAFCERLLKCKTSREKHETMCRRKKNVIAGQEQSRNITSNSEGRKSHRLVDNRRLREKTVSKSVRDKRKIMAASYVGLEVKCVVGKGRGLFARRQFKQGDIVCDYGGELVVGKREIGNRHTRYSKESGSNPGSYMYEFCFNSRPHCVDATTSQSLGRFANHSRLKPNTKMFVIGQHGATIPTLILKAIRKINRGEEILHDYGDNSAMSLQSFPWLKD